MICSGADHSMFRNVVRSIKRWASTDIKLTISPTVEERFAAFVITSDCINTTSQNHSDKVVKMYRGLY